MKNVKQFLLSSDEFFGNIGQQNDIVLSSRIRLARNLASYKFPNWASDVERDSIAAILKSKLNGLKHLNDGVFFNINELADHEKLALCEHYMISKDLSLPGAWVACSNDQVLSIMINEEDHLRIQVLRGGVGLKMLWKMIADIDDALNGGDFAFDKRFGYLTACPTNIGTGMRASVMMHLPGLVINKQIRYTIDALNKIGIAVRGALGEGTEAFGKIFQVSNQYTLGLSEEDIIIKIEHVAKTVIEHEEMARDQIFKSSKAFILDKICRAHGILRSCYRIGGAEAFELLSLMRLASEREILPISYINAIDRYMLETQKGHLMVFSDEAAMPECRDIMRAKILRNFFSGIEISID
ncbi:MAG: ATP--guanido phosphotransferase [Puniceicoccales bacterium]|jgi:protein arginine kinase|nr:ATP--guanido phosphotransferase [Puniceicoccales bacterium]